MKITWYGNASVLLEAEGEGILFDPFLELKGGEHPVPICDYTKYGNICITHGHLDHLASIPAILEKSSPTIYCTRQAEINLSRCYSGEIRVQRVAPGDCFNIGKVKLTVFAGKHIRYDGKLILKKAFNRRVLRYFSNLLYIGRTVRRFPEKGETVVYLAEGEGKRVLIMGSLGLGEAEYPTGADLFVCPFQGNSHIEELAGKVVERLRPKAVMLDHFDDAFPPLSESMDTSRFCEELAARQKDMTVIVPVFGQSTEI